MEDILTTDIYQLTNPTSKDFTFRYNSREYIVPAQHSRLYPQPIAIHGAKRLAGLIIRGTSSALALNQRVVAEQMDKICKLYQTTEASPSNALEMKIEELNKSNEEEVSPEEEARESKLDEEREKELDAFSTLNDDQIAETERLQALQENNPKGYRLEMLSKMTKQELLSIAEELEVEGFNSRTKNELIIEAILEAEF